MLSKDKKLNNELNDERRYLSAPIVQIRMFCVRVSSPICHLVFLLTLEWFFLPLPILPVYFSPPVYA